MQPEVEARFANVDSAIVRETLHKLGATCPQPMHDMRRAIIDYPDRRLQIGQPNAWGFVRVRDDGKKVTVTYKYVTNTANKDTYEIEFEVSSFDKTVEFFEAIGLKKHSEQHTRRELWQLDGCDVTIDEWPWIEPMVEVEGPDEATVKVVATKLGFVWDDRVTGNAQDVYARTYPGIGEHESISQIPLLTFDGAMPDWLKQRQHQ